MLNTSTAPVLVISDGVDEMGDAVRQAWPQAAGTSTPSPFVLRNQRRTTTMLGLIRLHLNGTDSPARYATALRSWLESHHGTPPAQRTGYDAGTSRRLPAAARQVASLRR